MIRARHSRVRRRRREKTPRGRVLRGVPDISTLVDRHQGETIVIYGNSGSLLKTDLKPLKQFTSIGVNRILRLLWPTYFYTCNDSVIHDESERMKAAVETVTMILFPGLMSTRNKKFIPLDFPHVSTGPIAFHGEFLKKSGTLDAGRDTGNSSYQSAQIAYRMGAKRIVLAGNDLTTVHRQPSHFYGAAAKNCKMGITKMKVEDWSRMNSGYRHAGVELVSCSPWKSPLRDVVGYVAPSSL